MSLQELLLTQDYQKKENFHMFSNFLYLWCTGFFFFQLNFSRFQFYFLQVGLPRTFDNASHPKFFLNVSQLFVLVMCVSATSSVKSYPKTVPGLLRHILLLGGLFCFSQSKGIKENKLRVDVGIIGRVRNGRCEVL